MRNGANEARILSKQESSLEANSSMSACTADEFQFFVLTPAGYPNPALAIAATRADAVGIVNVETGSNFETLSQALDALVRLSAGSFGAKLPGSQNKRLLEAALSCASSGLKWIITDSDGIEAWSEQFETFRAGGGRVICETLAWRPALKAIEDRIDGWIAKGHECGGVVGESSSFVLLQQLATNTRRPIYVRGGITEYTAAACWVGGASGAVIDDQALLLRDSPLAQRLRPHLSNVSGTETEQIESPNGAHYLRCLAAPGQKNSVNALRSAIAEQGDIAPELVSRLSWSEGEAAPVGQSMVFARRWADEYRSLGRALHAMRKAVRELPAQALGQRALDENSPLARENGTRWPIVQGPMSRVSDRAAFLKNVAEGGALPMAALSLMRKGEVDKLLKETHDQLGGRPWGVGLLGFANAEIRAEQLEAIAGHRPPFAVIAGARINQVIDFENRGIATYVHVPTAALLMDYLEQGVRKFIVEGRECGGHIGPLTSFVLWSTIVDALKDHPILQKQKESVHVLFAGGIHDDRSAAMAATIAAPLVAKGVRFGVLMGTGYLFTQEATASAAVVPEYQKIALECSETACLWEGPGYANRCAVTPIADTFRTKKRELEANGSNAQSVREEMETFSLGRLRMASKGVARNGPRERLESVSVDEQRSDGMYMMGEIAILNHRVRTIAEFHEDVGKGGLEILNAAVCAQHGRKLHVSAESSPKPANIAIVGMGCLLPKAQSIQQYWDNILDGRNAITDIPADRWDVEAYFSSDPEERDKVYAKRGGFLDDVPFDPLQYGIPPASLASIDPMQLLALELVRQTLEDAGYPSGVSHDWERTSVVFGFSGGLGELGTQYVARSELARLFGEAGEDVLSRLPEWTEDSFAGLLPNVTAGRVANRFNFGGTNMTVDAACASSLAALYQAVLELQSGHSDVVIAGGVDNCQAPFGYLCFSKTHALSPRGECHTFDESADGIVISEGLAAVVLKRLEDAERDGDRIYAVIKGIGASSDGRAKGISAPLPTGQRRAFRRSYAQAGYEPSTVDLFEAHGTGTFAGDRAELETVIGLLEETGAPPRNSAIGSVKNLIGHTKATAGLAGLIKATLGLHHRVLPPHPGVKKPNPALSKPDCPVHLLQAAQPWLRNPEHPRRAGVSSFGFGGTNFHVTLEEYDREYRSWSHTPARAAWQCELFAWRAQDRAHLAQRLEETASELQTGEVALSAISQRVTRGLGTGSVALSFVAASPDELKSSLREALEWLGAPGKERPSHIFFSESPLLTEHKLAVLFPGQGAQYPNMLRELAVLFPEVADAIDDANRTLSTTPTFSEASAGSLSRYIYPGDFFAPEAQREAMKALTRTEITQPALGAVEAGLWSLMQRLGLRADMCAGHSYGEFAALRAAGVLSGDDLIALSEARGRAIADEARSGPSGAMAAIDAAADEVGEALGRCPDVVLANLNSPRQTVIAGTEAAVVEASRRLQDAGFTVHKVPVSQAFHSPLMNGAQSAFATALSQCAWHTPQITVYSNTLAKPHASDAHAIRAVMGDHLISPVNFLAMVEAMYADGARVFLELGPKTILTSRVTEILGARQHHAVAIDTGHGLRSFLEALAALVVEGGALDLSALYAGRDAASACVREPTRSESDAPRTAYLVNGGYVRGAGEPRRDMRRPPKSNVEVVPQDKNSVSRVETLGSEFMDYEHKEVRRRPAEAEGLDEPMAAYHRLMGEFLQVQERVMLAYLGSDRAIPAEAAHRLGAPAIDEPPSLAQIEGETVKPPHRPVEETPPQAANGALNGNGALHALKTNGHVATTVDEPTAEIANETGDVKTLLLRIVSNKTGYPEDALALDQNLEADLGIDSIKKMEILGAVRKQLPAAQAQSMQQNMETVADLPSLQAIIDFLGVEISPLNGQIANGETRPFDLTGEGETAQAVLPRFILAAHAEPADDVQPETLPSGLYILTQDGLGVAEHLTSRLRRHGLETAILPISLLVDEDALKRWLSENAGLTRPVRGVIHLSGLFSEPADLAEIDLESWRQQMERGTKSVFRLLRHCACTLQDGGRFIAATATGGHFGRDYLTRETLPTGIPSSSGCIGLVKALSLEWPGCRAKAIDLDMNEAPESLADYIYSELTLPGGRREVGYPEGVRTIFRTEPASLTPAVDALTVDKDWVILATGGACGITAETLRGLAPFGPRLVLVGRSAKPAAEPNSTAALDKDELRAHFIDKAKAAGASFRPVDIERSVASILTARQIRKNIEDLTRLGAQVAYESADVTCERSVRRLVEGLYERYGRIDAVIHGAGIIDDGLLAKKTPESIDRVFDTKVDSTFLLARLIRPESLKFFCMFTSVAGRYGNRGQTDYAAANETLNRLGWVLQRRWGPGVKVRAINWGPWAGTSTGSGMVTPEVRLQFEARGVSLVEPGPGREFLLKELLWSPHGEVEVVAGDAQWEYFEERHGALAKVNGPMPLGPRFPILQNATIVANGGGRDSIEWCFDLVNAPFADHHRFDGIPVMPLAGILELLAEAAAALGFEGEVTELRDVRLFRGLTLENGPTRLRICCSGSDGGSKVDLKVVAAEDPDKLFYTATALLSKTVPSTAGIEGPPSRPIPDAPLSIGEVYERWLSHGPIFQTLTELISVSDKRVLAQASSTVPSAIYPAADPDQWLFDPALLDGAIQTMWIWTRTNQGAPALPLGIKSVRRYGGETGNGPVTIENLFHSGPDDPSIDQTIRLWDSAGRLTYIIEHLEGHASRKLNRLAGGWQGGRPIEGFAERVVA